MNTPHRTRTIRSWQDKLDLIQQYDALHHGEKGPWLSRRGLSSSSITDWRREREMELLESTPETLQPKPSTLSLFQCETGEPPVASTEEELERLREENAQLAGRLAHVEELLAVHRRLSSLLDSRLPATGDA